MVSNAELELATPLQRPVPGAEAGEGQPLMSYERALSPAVAALITAVRESEEMGHRKEGGWVMGQDFESERRVRERGDGGRRWVGVD